MFNNNINKKNFSDITIADGNYISSLNGDEPLFSLIQKNVSRIDFIFIELKDFKYKCRLQLFSGCNFNGTLIKLNELLYDEDNIFIIENISYAEREYECYVTFISSITNKSYIINAEDGGMVFEECNIISSFDIVKIKKIDAHYGCCKHIEFFVPNTNSQPFTLRIEAEIDDIYKIW